MCGGGVLAGDLDCGSSCVNGDEGASCYMYDGVGITEATVAVEHP